MRMNLMFEISGAPRGKGRPRFAKVGKFIKTYTDDKTAAFENLVAISYMQNLDRPPLPLDCPVKIEVWFHMPIPASWSKKKREAAIGKPCSTKPDIDNMTKAILDGLNGLAFTDDSRVCAMRCDKMYSHRPRTEIILSWEV